MQLPEQFLGTLYSFPEMKINLLSRNPTGRLLGFLETHKVIKGSIFNFCLLSLSILIAKLFLFKEGPFSALRNQCLQNMFPIVNHFAYSVKQAYVILHADSGPGTLVPPFQGQSHIFLDLDILALTHQGVSLLKEKLLPFNEVLPCSPFPCLHEGMGASEISTSNQNFFCGHR